MANESQQKVTISVPLDFDLGARQDLGDLILEFIVERTDKGLDKNNTAFKAYSTSYTESLDFKNAGKSAGDVNLTLTGDMLTDLQVLDTSVTGFITIGFIQGTEENNRAAWNRNNTRASFPKRDFLGITPKDLNKLIRIVRSRSSFEVEVNETVQREASSLIGSIFDSFINRSR